MKRVKAALCPLCGGWVIVSVCPHGDIDPDTLSEFRRAATDEYTIEYITNEQLRDGIIERCSCGDTDAKQPELALKESS